MSNNLFEYVKEFNKLYEAGAVKVVYDTTPDLRYDLMNYILTVRAYIPLTENLLKQDFKEWKESYIEYRIDEEEQDTVKTYYFTDDSNRQSAYARMSLAKAEIESRKRKKEIKAMTFDQWANKAGDNKLLKDVRAGMTIYRLIYLGQRVMASRETPVEATTISIKRMFDKMLNHLQKNCVILPKSMNITSTTRPLPHIIYIGEVKN